jgi:hypothetical protein
MRFQRLAPVGGAFVSLLLTSARSCRQSRTPDLASVVFIKDK